jgi:uncharacterized membrane protein YagU involved in acid resistance
MSTIHPPASSSRRAPRRTHPPTLASSPSRELLVGIAGGLAASLVTGAVDRLIDPLVSAEQKRRERRVRGGSAHEVAGPRAARKLLGRRPSRREARIASAVFTGLYSVVWGAVYALVRRKVPRAARLAGLPFAVPFFLACDGGIAPLLGLTPGLPRVPWQLSVKELLNHVAWTATAEAAHRLASSRRSA